MDLLKTRIELYDELLKAARGELVIDSIIESGNIVNVLTGETQQGNIGIHKGFIVSLFNNNIDAQRTINAHKKTIIPSFIDPHIHIESSMILPTTYAEVVALNGTGTIFADPHEIVNVMGIEGFKLMIKNSKNLPARIFFDIPTCVPAKRAAESSGADIRANEIIEMIHQGGKKLGELMSVDEIISGDPIMGGIIKTGWEESIPRDAHFHWLLPSLAQTFTSLSLGEKLKLYSGFIGGKILRINRLYDLSVNVLVNSLRNLDNSSLDTYLVALGLTADHENYGPELQIKLDHGMRLILSSHIFSFPEMVPLLLRAVRRLRYKDTIGMCTDDLWPDELIRKGGMLGFVKALIKHGLDPIDVIRFATLNNAQRLAQSGIIEANLIGSIVPGQIADIIILDGPLKKMNIDTVVHEGQVVSKNGELLKFSPSPEVPAPALRTVKVPEISEKTFQIPIPSNFKDVLIKTRVLSLPKPPALPFPKIIEEDIPIQGSFLDTEGYTTITVLNRYKENNHPPSRGIIRGYSIENGALASTVAHDSHNFIVLGSNIANMVIVARKVIEMNGGLVASQNGKIIANIALPVGGLMSTAPIKELCKSAEKFRNALENLGLDPGNPIMPFALFSLPAVPGAKVTDLGLWDDKQKKIVSIYV